MGGLRLVLFLTLSCVRAYDDFQIVHPDLRNAQTPYLVMVGRREGGSGRDYVL